MYRGHTATLPCWLNPPQNAEGLEVHWYRGGDSLILFYRGKKFEDTSQEASYVGRVSFGLKDAASGGLATGDVSLKLKNVTIEDAGEYTCYVSSDQSYDRATVSLQVIGESSGESRNTKIWFKTLTSNGCHLLLLPSNGRPASPVSGVERRQHVEYELRVSRLVSTA